MESNDPLYTRELLRRQLDIPRGVAAALGNEAVQIIQAGFYISPTGNRIEIQEQINRSVQGTVTYGPENHLPESAHLGRTTRIEVLNTTTFAAVQQLIRLGYQPAALNFASATSPGGGFLSGSRA
jgi:uncharacterized protein (TIGR02452 family)